MTIHTEFSCREPIFISDCTLRDFRNSPGVYFSDDEAIEIARYLAATGIDEIEVGVINNPKSSEVAFIRKIADLNLPVQISSAFFAMKTSDISPAMAKIKAAACDAVLVTISTSPLFLERKLRRSFRGACSLLNKTVKAAAAEGLSVVCGGEDAGRTPLEDLVNFAKAAEDAGADRIRFAETVACLSPAQMYDRIATMSDAVSIPIEVHCHSALGMGVANSVAALDAGARGLSLTVEGFGERGGNTSLTTMLLYLWKFRGHDHFDLSQLKGLSDYVANVTRMPIHRFNPITGDSAFEFECGNQYINADIYEAFDPELVGNKRKLAFGVKQDSAGLKLAFGDDTDAKNEFALRAGYYTRNARAPLYYETHV